MNVDSETKVPDQHPEKRIQFSEDERPKKDDQVRPYPLKRIQIHVQSASQLPLLPNGAQPNPYVRIRIGNKTPFRTKTVKRSQNPSWHENSPAVEVHTCARVVIKLMHRSLWPGGDVPLAEVEWSVEDIMSQPESCDKDHMFETFMISRIEGFSPSMVVGVRELASEKQVPSLVSAARQRAASYSLTLKEGPSSKGSTAVSDAESSPSNSSSGLSEADSTPVAQ